LIVDFQNVITPRRMRRGLATHRVHNIALERQRGAVAILTALFLVVLLALAAFAIDIARWYLVRNELQNAADAAALAGAACVNPSTQCGSLPNATAPDFTVASSAAATAISLNKAVNVTLQTGQVTAGGWNLSSPASGVTAPPVTLSASQVPAVSVTISEASGANNGPMSLFFGKFVGRNSLSVKASATATAGLVAQGHAFPMAINECLYNNLSQFWNPITNEPLTVPSSQNGQTLSQINPAVWGSSDQTMPQTAGQNYIIQINSTYSSDDSCNAGQWTPLDNSGNVGGAAEIKNYIAGTQSTPSVSTGSQIFIMDGTKASGYGTTDSCSANDGDGTCAYELFPVVNQQPIASGTTTAVVGFACLKIYAAQQGNSVKGIPKGKYIAVQLVANSASRCQSGGVGIGPSYGAYGPPRLVQ
jgi:Flp pilus assembly protein TadG